MDLPTLASGPAKTTFGDHSWFVSKDHPPIHHSKCSILEAGSAIYLTVNSSAKSFICQMCMVRPILQCCCEGLLNIFIAYDKYTWWTQHKYLSFFLKYLIFFEFLGSLQDSKLRTCDYEAERLRRLFWIAYLKGITSPVNPFGVEKIFFSSQCWILHAKFGAK